MAAPMGVPPLRPSAGFCVQTESTGSPPGRWYVNMCRHKMIDMPLAYSGRPVSRDYILSHGIGNLQVPFDMGTFRKLKQRADGAKQTTYCVDVVFNPLMIQLFMDDEFCNAEGLKEFRPFMINLALNRIEESIGVKLSVQKVKLVKSLRYKDGEDDDAEPREFTELPGHGDSFDEELPQKRVEEPSTEELIKDVTPGAGRQQKLIKKGFLNQNSKSLYGPDGSGEGVLPENAGDPMGFIPKGLRQKCNIVDTGAPEYQEAEKKRRAAEESNDMNKEFRDTLQKDLASWCKATEQDKWEKDLPDGVESAPCKYDVDYSRFKDIGEAEEAAPVPARDWYCDKDGKVQRMPTGSTQIPLPKASETQMRKGFLDSAKSPLYPKGSEQAKAPPGDEQIMKEMANILGQEDHRSCEPQSKNPSVAVKVPDYKAPEFTVSREPDSLKIIVSVPRLESMQGVSLDVTERRASLTFPSGASLKPLQVELPASVIPTSARAKFSKKRCEIAVTLPLAAD